MNVIIFYKSACSYSQKALSLLREHYDERDIHSIEVSNKMDDLKSFLQSRGIILSRYTVPQVFFEYSADLEPQYIGGYTELSEKLKKN